MTSSAAAAKAPPWTRGPRSAGPVVSAHSAAVGRLGHHVRWHRGRTRRGPGRGEHPLGEEAVGGAPNQGGIATIEADRAAQDLSGQRPQGEEA